MPKVKRVLNLQRLVEKRRSSDWLIVGLGNPGNEYVGTRHNVGFHCVDLIEEAAGNSWKFNGSRGKVSDLSYEYSSLSINGSGVAINAHLVKPLSYMNRSGFSVSKVANFYKVTADRVIVIHDELDIPLGTVKIKLGGGEAGHNGLKSISNQLGTKSYCRVRLGIDKPSNSTDPKFSRMSVSSWVLSRFASSDNQTVQDMLEQAAKATLDILTMGVNDAQAKWNRTR